MQWRLLACLIPMTFILLPAGPALADIYAFVDKNGVRHLSNVPNDSRYKMVMRTPAYRRDTSQVSSFAPTNLYNGGRFYGSGSGNAYWPSSYQTPNASAPRRFSRINEDHRQRLTPDVNRIAAQHQLDPALLHAVISAESSYNPWAVSPKGAMGLMQLMPGTAARFGVGNAYDPIANVQGGARYLRWLLNQFNDTRLAVAAYNAGEGAVQKYGNQIPPYRETRNYVVKVLDYYQKYRGGSGMYYAGNTGGSAPLAMNSNFDGRYYSSGATRNPGVVVITPRQGNRPASLTNVATGANSRAYSSAGTYYQPSSSRVIAGSSGSRPPVQVNLPTRPTASDNNAALFAGNDK